MGEETTLRKLRKASGMSIRQMASRLGVKEDRLRKWETGAATMNIVQAAEVSDVLGCSIDVLVGHGKTPMESDEYELLRLYRSSNAQGRAAIMAVARSQAGGMGGESSLARGVM